MKYKLKWPKMNLVIHCTYVEDIQFVFWRLWIQGTSLIYFALQLISAISLYNYRHCPWINQIHLPQVNCERTLRNINIQPVYTIPLLQTLYSLAAFCNILN